MTKSEQLLSVIAESYFFKDLTFDELCFVPKNSTEIELADLVLNMGDIILAIQLKERNKKEQTENVDTENKWLQKKCGIAKNQVKKSIDLISKGQIPKFVNKRGSSIELKSDAEIIPLVVFENSAITDYPHLLRKHSEDSVDINCMSMEDFQEMCRVLVTPFEIVSYLKYRKNLFEQYGEVNVIMFDDGKDGISICRPTSNEALVYNFLIERYGFDYSFQDSSWVIPFHNFLKLLPEKVITSSGKNGSYELIQFFSHLCRTEISCFMERLIETRDAAKSGESGIYKSLRRKDDEYAILFIAGDLIEMEYVLPFVKEKADVKRILEIGLYWETKEDYRINFLYWEKHHTQKWMRKNEV